MLTVVLHGTVWLEFQACERFNMCLLGRCEIHSIGNAGSYTSYMGGAFARHVGGLYANTLLAFAMLMGCVFKKKRITTVQTRAWCCV